MEVLLKLAGVETDDWVAFFDTAARRSEPDDLQIWHINRCIEADFMSGGEAAAALDKNGKVTLFGDCGGHV